MMTLRYKMKEMALCKAINNKKEVNYARSGGGTSSSPW